MENSTKIRLLCGKECGTNSKKIYEKYAEMYGWDRRQSSQFGAQGQPLYAREATPEGYSVWCISYSNLNDKKGGQWRNRFSDDKDTNDLIEELWEYRTHDRLHDFSETTTRIVFAKNRKGEYEFFGVYKCVSRSEKREKIEWADAYGYVKTYRRISKFYPFNS